MQIRYGFALALILAATFAAYSASLFVPFVYDDGHAVIGNPAVAFQRPISLHESRWVSLLSFRLNFLLSAYSNNAQEPFWYHVVNLTLHGLNILLVFAVARLWIPQTASLFAAGIFALHPMQTEAVIYVSGRTELLSVLFVLLALWTYQRGRYLLTGMCCLLGIFSKESAAVALLIIGFCELRKRSVSAEILVPAFALMLFAGSIMLPTLHLETPERSWFDHLTLQSAQVLHYLGMVVLPIGQTIDHDAEMTSNAVGAVAFACLLAIGGLAWAFRFTSGGLAAAILMLAILPRLLINIPEFMAEHHMYLPFLGISILMALGLQRLSEVRA